MDTQQLETTSILSLFETTKAERAGFVQDVINRLNEGQADVIKVHLHIKAMEDVVKGLNDNKEYKVLLLEAAENYGKKFERYNAEFNIREVGVKYDYSQCNDPELVQLQAQCDEISEKIKAKQKFLQTVPQAGIEILFNDELVRVYPPSKSSTTSVAVTLK